MYLHINNVILILSLVIAKMYFVDLLSYVNQVSVILKDSFPGLRLSRPTLKARPVSGGHWHTTDDRHPTKLNNSVTCSGTLFTLILAKRQQKAVSHVIGH